MNEPTEIELLKQTIARLLVAIRPFRAKHKQDRCDCRACDDLRDAITYANEVLGKKTVTYQDPEKNK